jgi:hypothetical protein
MRESNFSSDKNHFSDEVIFLWADLKTICEGKAEFRQKGKLVFIPARIRMIIA